MPFIGGGGQAGGVALATGGTGGHVFAAVGMAAALKRSGWQAALICPDDERTRRFIAAEPEAADLGVEFYRWGRGGRVAGLLPAVFNARGALKRSGADALVSLGGYAGLASGLAGLSLGIPLVLFEENAVAGRSSRLLSPLAALRLSPMPLGGFRPVGLPLRERILAAKPAPGGPALGGIDEPVILVIGGSQGARTLDEAMMSIYGRLALLEPRPVVVHIAGPDMAASARLEYERAFGAWPAWAGVYGFRSDIDELYHRANLVVSRAGALAVAEISYLGLPAVLVPYPHAGYHQFQNAKALAMLRPDITRTVEQGDGFAERLLEALGELLLAGGKARSSGCSLNVAPLGDAGGRFVEALRGLLDGR